MELVRAAVTAAPLPTTHDEHLQRGDCADTDGSVTGGRVWRIGCRDVIDRERCLTVLVERNQVVDGQVVVRPMMYVALTYDHRLVDGREAVQFLVRIKDFVEDPALMLVEG